MTTRPQDTIITAQVSELLDPEIHTPPKGVQLLVAAQMAWEVKKAYGCP